MYILHLALIKIIQQKQYHWIGHSLRHQFLLLDIIGGRRMMQIIIIIIIVIVKVHLYSAKSCNAANALNRQLHCKQKWLQFISECFDYYVWGSEVSRKTVPRPRSLYCETAIAIIRSGSWNRQSTRVRRLMLAADNRWQWLAVFP